MPRRTIIVLAAITAAAAAASPAAAATISVDSAGRIVYRAAPGEINKPTVSFVACAPEATCPAFRITEEAGSTTAYTVTAPGCFSTATSVSCAERPEKVIVVLADGDDDARVFVPGKVSGGEGRDLIETIGASAAGDEGDDTLRVSGASASGGDGNDVIGPRSSFSTAALRLSGGAGHDRITGGAGGDLLNGGSGRDLLDGAGGSDRLFGGSEGDRIFAGEGTADALIDCGEHGDSLIRDPFDPAGTGCERVSTLS